jgi:DNA polymerase III delta' subunit
MPLTPLPSDHARHTWETLVGNALARDSVRRAIDEGRLPHGLLFHGPEQIGKLGFAVATAKHLLAGAWPPETDEAKRTVEKIGRATHPDVLFVAPDVRAGKALQIKIEDIREIDRLAPLTPIEVDRRVVIIDQAERMNPNTANSLLKLLEEPPAHCVFLLTSHRRSALLPTILSRCTPLRLGPVRSEELAAWLVETQGLEQEQAQLAARWAEGRPGAALSLPLDQWEARLRTVDEIMAEFIACDFSGVFRTAARLLALGDGAKGSGETPLVAALRWTRLWLRDRLIAAVASEQTHLLAGRPGLAAAAGWTPELLCTLGDEIETLAPLAARPIDAHLALETALTYVGAAKGRAQISPTV